MPARAASRALAETPLPCSTLVIAFRNAWPMAELPGPTRNGSSPSKESAQAFLVLALDEHQAGHLAADRRHGQRLHPLDRGRHFGELHLRSRIGLLVVLDGPPLVDAERPELERFALLHRRRHGEVAAASMTGVALRKFTGGLFQRTQSERRPWCGRRASCKHFSSYVSAAPLPEDGRVRKLRSKSRSLMPDHTCDSRNSSRTCPQICRNERASSRNLLAGFPPGPAVGPSGN